MRSSPVKRAMAETVIGLQEIIATKESAFSEQFFGPELSLTHARWMCDTILVNINNWPIDKTGRWIGFVQGVLACHQILDVNAERDRTRPLYHAAYAEEGAAIPKTQDRPSEPAG